MSSLSRSAEFRRGAGDGLTIALGYLSVSFTFGIMAVLMGFRVWQAVIISLFCVTSAGQFAGIKTIAYGGSLIEMALSQFIINLRYALMSITVSQKMDDTCTPGRRAAIGFGITDEIFGVSVSRNERIDAYYMYGLIVVPVLGWTIGTLAGALAGSVLPGIIVSSMGIALYGMFMAIVIPEAKKDRHVLIVSLAAAALSSVFYFVPVLKKVSSGFVIIICACVTSALGAILFPVDIDDASDDKEIS